MRLMENTGMLPSDAIESSVITPHVTVPTTACTYVCPAHELPHDREYHLVRFKVKTFLEKLILGLVTKFGSHPPCLQTLWAA